jgi:hypothetical protein
MLSMTSVSGHRLKCGRRDGVAEYIQRPGHHCTGCHHNIARDELKLAAFTRSEHQAMRPEMHRLMITIGRPVMNPERDQENLHRARSSVSFQVSLRWNRRQMIRQLQIGRAGTIHVEDGNQPRSQGKLEAQFTPDPKAPGDSARVGCAT